MRDLPEYVLDRVFDAPRELVWRAWTDPELIQHWYGPGVETIIHKFELVPEGVWLNEMKMGENSFFQKVVFKEISEPGKMVWHHCSADSDWNVSANAMMPDWPKMLLTTATFEEVGNKTNARLSQVPLDPTEAEITCFESMMAGMSGGWGKGYAIIDELLAKMRLDKK